MNRRMFLKKTDKATAIAATGLPAASFPRSAEASRYGRRALHRRPPPGVRQRVDRRRRLRPWLQARIVLGYYVAHRVVGKDTQPELAGLFKLKDKTF